MHDSATLPLVIPDWRLAVAAAAAAAAACSVLLEPPSTFSIIHDGGGGVGQPICKIRDP